MKPLSVILVILASSAVSSGLTVSLLGDSSAPEVAASVAPSGMQQSLDKLNQSLAQQQRELEQLRTSLAMQAGSERQAAGDPVDIDEVVRRVLAEEGVGAGLMAKPAIAQAQSRPFDLQTTMGKLKDAGGLSWVEREAIWSELRESGNIDKVLEEFKQLALLDPENPAVHVKLGEAYIQKLQGVSDGPEKGMLATMADQAYDRALEIDDHNWDARYNKAVSLSFWPPLFGKQKDAINHFEILIDQQQSAEPNPAHASTFVFLGNLYQQSGQLEKAAAIWQQGYDAFPDNDDLANRVEN